MYVPAAQVLQAVESVSLENVPGEQSVHDDDPFMSVNLPWGQGKHTELFAACSVTEKEPDGQLSHTDAPPSCEKNPGKHGLQFNDPGEAAKNPGRHSRHCDVPLACLYFPTAQG